MVEANSETLVLAYLAGLLDADGAFCIHLTKGASGELTIFSPLIQLKQVQREGADLLFATFGGPKVTIKKASAENGKPLFYWRLQGPQAVEAARRLLPFLRLKQRQAELLIALGEEIERDRGHLGAPRLARTKWGTTTMRRYRATSPGSLARRKAIVREIRQLNDSRRPNPWPDDDRTLTDARAC